jgi:D-arabinose 1-dehydrogenase-like Zn-dependent alcohol dehydrogenase
MTRQDIAIALKVDASTISRDIECLTVKSQQYIEKPGLENLKIMQDVEEPKITDHDVLIKVKMSGINPIDHFAVSGSRETKPIPHIPGAESAGEVEKIGKQVTGVKQGDRVVVYSRVFDGTCDMCLKGYEMLCRSGGIFGIMTNGGVAEYTAVPEKNVFKMGISS